MVTKQVWEVSGSGGSWGILAGSRGGSAGGTGPPPEGDPAAAGTTGAKQLVPLTVPTEGDEAQEPVLDTPCQIPAQQKHLRHGPDACWLFFLHCLRGSMQYNA